MGSVNRSSTAAGGEVSMSASLITAFNQSANPSNEQVVVFGWIAEYFESIFDDESARYCRNISESLKNQVSAQQEVKS